MAYIPPVIVVPGVTGTSLSDDYPLPPEVVWAVLRQDHPRLALHPDNRRYEAQEPARIQPGAIFEAAYKGLIEEARFNLRERDDRPVPVYPFGYDWRQPLFLIEQQLNDFVNEVIERTSLVRHYRLQGYADDPKVSLIGHSMGGLIITGYLDRRGAAARVAKVATLATPFGGSFEAVIKVVTGTANLSLATPESREREAARTMPSLYHLLPTIPDALEIDDPTLPKTLFDPALWQPSVLRTIEDFVGKTAVSQKDRAKQARNLFAAMLREAQQYRSRLDKFTLKKANLKPEDWLCVVGVNAVTRVRLKITRSRSGPEFDLGSEHRSNQWETGQTPAQKRLTGDGTVPFEAALPPFLAPENVVCVVPDDYGYWELLDKVVLSKAGFHAIMPTMNMIQRLIVRHFTGRSDPHGNTWGRPAPGVENWQPPLRLTLKQ